MPFFRVIKSQLDVRIGQKSSRRHGIANLNLDFQKWYYYIVSKYVIWGQSYEPLNDLILRLEVVS